jgi:Pilus formation protein N terminal region
MIKKVLLNSVCVFLFAAFASTANAGAQRLYLEVDESQMLTLPASPGTIVIGNPAIADVSIQGKQIFLHGKAFGQTSLTILGLNGDQIAAFTLVTKHDQEDSVFVYKVTSALNDGLPSRYSYTCAPKCEGETQIGDEIKFNTMMRDQTAGKFEMSTGNKNAEATAPQAPQ